MSINLTQPNLTRRDFVRTSMLYGAGALLSFDSDGEYTVTQFEAVPHPPLRPMAYASGGMGSMFGF